MTDDSEITVAFWASLRSDRTVMLGLDNFNPPTLRPMTALMDSDRDGGPIWFFTSNDSAIVQGMALREEAIFTFASKGHDVFATVQGALSRSVDRGVIDRLWNPTIAAWYQGGKEDPAMAVLRLDPMTAEIWRDESSLFSGLRMLLGVDPQEAYKDKTARVSLA